jgi:hypothetical protein
VLFWSELVILLLVAVALGRSPLTPLRARTGSCSVSACRRCHCRRPRSSPDACSRSACAARDVGGEGRWLFDLRQLALVAWVAVAIVIMFTAVRDGLLSSPDMHVSGNGSHAELLRWFSDRTGATPPGVWIVSLPLLVYRIAMLAWALWLAVALIRWSRLGLDVLRRGGLWRPLRKAARHAGRLTRNALRARSAPSVRSSAAIAAS